MGYATNITCHYSRNPGEAIIARKRVQVLLAKQCEDTQNGNEKDTMRGEVLIEFVSLKMMKRISSVSRRSL